MWKVKHKHLPTGEQFEEEYDFVIVGTGHHSKPKMPNIPGEKLFKGISSNFHNYVFKFGFISTNVKHAID